MSAIVSKSPTDEYREGYERIFEQQHKQPDLSLYYVARCKGCGGNTFWHPAETTPTHCIRCAKQLA